METMFAKAKAKGYIIGTYCYEIADAKKWMDKGVDFIDYSTDTVMFMEKCKETVQALHS